MKKETRVMIRKRTMKYIEKALESQQSIPLSDSTYVEGLGEITYKTVAKEGNEYVLYKMDRNNPGDYQRKKLTKNETLRVIEKYLETFSKNSLNEEFEYWKECVSFLEEENNVRFIDSYLSNVTVN